MIDNIWQEIFKIPEKVLKILLIDRTTRKNICWATDLYIDCGAAYCPEEEITKKTFNGINNRRIKPRIAKTNEEQLIRTKDRAEVFTPSWVCNEQNNLIDEEWFGEKNIFNKSIEKKWITNNNKIVFPKNKSWKEYVNDRRLEITCGEAPYIVSRYDSVTGEKILLKERIGLLDRKMRVINENTSTEEDWMYWVKRAYESIYGYEYQGDNLLMARINLFYTFIENMEYKFGHNPNEKQLQIIAKIISWNIWQMDGITMTVPYSGAVSSNEQISIFENEIIKKEPILARIYDWRANKSLEFKSMLK